MAAFVDTLMILTSLHEIASGVFYFFNNLQLYRMPSCDLRVTGTEPPAVPEGTLVAITGFTAAPSPLTSASNVSSVANFSLEAQFRSSWGFLGSWPARPVFVARMPLGEAPSWGLSRAPDGAPPAAAVVVPVLPGALSHQFFHSSAPLASALVPSAVRRAPPEDASWGGWLRSLALMSSDQGVLHEQLHLPLGALVTVVGAVRSVRLSDGTLSVALARDWRRGLFLLGGGDFAGFRGAALSSCVAALLRVAVGGWLASLWLQRRAARHRRALRVAVPRDAPPDEPATDSNARCVACWDNASCMALVPCGHVCLCAGCVKKLAEQNPQLLCPTCRVEVAQCVRVYQ